MSSLNNKTYFTEFMYTGQTCHVHLYMSQKTFWIFLLAHAQCTFVTLKIQSIKIRAALPPINCVCYFDYHACRLRSNLPVQQILSLSFMHFPVRAHHLFVKTLSSPWIFIQMVQSRFHVSEHKNRAKISRFASTIDHIRIFWGDWMDQKMIYFLFNKNAKRLWCVTITTKR